MRHYVAYHNTERMGRALDAGNPFRVLTNKSVDGLIDGVVWMIVGEGQRPRRYSLGSVFRVTETGSADEPDFRNFAAGPGQIFLPAVELGDLEWFDDFSRSIGRFGLGLLPIRDRIYLDHLETLARQTPHVAADPRCQTPPELIFPVQVKVLSIKQPWIDHILYGEKWCENRTWTVHHRGPVYLHATRWDAGAENTSPGPGRTGAILGSVDLVEIVDLDLVGERGLRKTARAHGLPTTPAAMDFVSGSQCWIFTRPKLLAEPISMRGNLRLWSAELPPEQLR